MKIQKTFASLAIFGLLLSAAARADEIGSRPDNGLDANAPVDEATGESTDCTLCAVLESLGFGSDE